MALWKDGRFVANEWRLVPEGASLPSGAKVIVDLDRWKSDRADLIGREQPLGLLLAPDSDWADIVADLPRFDVIAVSFPKFADGRAFSIARLLRERDGYLGEIRAVGDYFIDQVPFMKRVGIDAFETDDPVLKKAFDRGEWPEVPNYLQPGLEGAAEVPAGTRPWARRSTGSE